MKVLEPHVRRTDIHTKIFEFAEEVEEMVWRQGELRRLDVLR